MVFWAMIPLLGACGTLHSLPSPPGAAREAPGLPGPFENYDPVRPPAFKRPPTPRPKPTPRPERADAEDPSYGGVLRPGLPRPPQGRDAEDEGGE
jgi:hypothetical protein